MKHGFWSIPNFCLNSDCRRFPQKDVYNIGHWASLNKHSSYIISNRTSNGLVRLKKTIKFGEKSTFAMGLGI